MVEVIEVEVAVGLVEAEVGAEVSSPRDAHLRGAISWALQCFQVGFD